MVIMIGKAVLKMFLNLVPSKEYYKTKLITKQKCLSKNNKNVPYGVSTRKGNQQDAS